MKTESCSLEKKRHDDGGVRSFIADDWRRAKKQDEAGREEFVDGRTKEESAALSSLRLPALALRSQPLSSPPFHRAIRSHWVPIEVYVSPVHG